MRCTGAHAGWVASASTSREASGCDGTGDVVRTKVQIAEQQPRARLVADCFEQRVELPLRNRCVVVQMARRDCRVIVADGHTCDDRDASLRPAVARQLENTAEVEFATDTEGDPVLTGQEHGPTRWCEVIVLGVQRPRDEAPAGQRTTIG